MQNIPFRKPTRNDWKIEPMPPESESLEVEWSYSSDEFSSITNGFIPDSMDDKWFIFYDEPFLYLHRSWTGFCIFAMRFEALPDGMRIAEVIVNRNPNQCGQIGTDATESLAMLRRLLDNIAQPDTPRQMQKRAQELARIQNIVAVAKAILAGEVDVVEGAGRLAMLGGRTKAQKGDEFSIFELINSEAPFLPPEKSRQYWNQDVLKLREGEIADYEARVKEAVLDACRKLLDNIHADSERNSSYDN